MLTTNVGGADRVLRILAGIAFLAYWFFVPGGSWHWVMAVIGVLMLGTAFLRTCPLYTVLGINTCPVKRA